MEQHHARYPATAPTGDLDTRDEIAEMIELGWTGPHARRARDLADNVARVHSHQLRGYAVSVGSGAST